MAPSGVRIRKPLSETGHALCRSQGAVELSCDRRRTRSGGPILTGAMKTEAPGAIILLLTAFHAN